MLIFLAPSEEKLPAAKPCKIALCEDFFARCAAQLEFFCPELQNSISGYFRSLKTAPEATTGAKNPAKILAAHGTDAAPALERYAGVAFAALDYASLTPAQQAFARSHVVIFSNLFGAVFGGEQLPYYKLKQGAQIAVNAQPAAICAQFQAPKIAAHIAAHKHAVIDLRAQFYEPFYALKTPHASVKITKNGRAQSHFAKHYRGLIARALIEEFAAQVSPDAPEKASRPERLTGVAKTADNTACAVAELEQIADILRARFGASCQFCGENLFAHIDFKDA